MTRLYRLRNLVAAALVALVLPTVALADVKPFDRSLPMSTLISNQGLDASRSFTLTAANTKGHNLLMLVVNHGTHNTATAIQMSCTGSYDGTGTSGTLQDCAVSSGTCTSSNASWSKAVSGTAAWIWRVDITGIPQVTCTFTDTAGDASDKLTVEGYLWTR
jgi:hypothetical protein